MNSRTSLCLRILLWLLMLADGGDNEGNAVRFPSFQPTSRQRLMTDNFLPMLPSSRSIPFSGVIGYQGASGPSFHSNRGLDQMEAPKSGYPSRLHALAFYPGYGTGRSSTFSQENLYGRPLNPSSHSPFRNLFGSDIGRPSGIDHSFGSPRKENAFEDGRNRLEMGPSDFQSYRNHPFSSLRLTPITKVSSVTVAGPNRQSNVISNKGWRDTSFDGTFGGNRAHNFDHKNPFEKPISRSAFPLPNVNDPITLDLAEDERKRVNYARDTNRLPPPRNFVYKPNPKTFDDHGDNENSNPTKLDKGLGLLDVDFNANQFKGNRLTSITIPELPSKKRSPRTQNGLARLPQDAHGELESNAIEPDVFKDKEDIIVETNSEPNANVDRNKTSSDRNELFSNDEAVPVGMLNDKRSGKESHVSNTDVSDRPSIHTYKKHDGGFEKQEDDSQHKRKYSGSSKGSYDVDQNSTMDASIKDNNRQSEKAEQNSLSKVHVDSNTNTWQGTAQSNIFPLENEEYPYEERQGVYDITTLRKETIQKKSGKLPDDINMTDDYNGIPATKRITEETIDSGRHTVVNNETNLPTDHVGFILTDQFYDEEDEAETATISSVSERQQDGEITDALMKEENANGGISDRDILSTDPTKYTFMPDFDMKENRESEIIQTFHNADTLESNGMAQDRPPIGSSYLFLVPGKKDGGLEHPIAKSDNSASPSDLTDSQNHLYENHPSTRRHGFDGKDNGIYVNEHVVTQEDDYNIHDDVTHSQNISPYTQKENNSLSYKQNIKGEPSNAIDSLASSTSEAKPWAKTLKDSLEEPITGLTPQPETLRLRLGVMKEGDALISDRQNQMSNYGYSANDSILGNTTHKAARPYLRKTEEKQQITLDNMDQYLEGDSNKSNASTTGSIHENIDENGMPNFSNYNYDSYGPTRDYFSPIAFDYNDNAGDDFSIDTDPTSLKFNVLKAGEGSLSVRKVSNTFDPHHKDVNTMETSLVSVTEANPTTETEYTDHQSDRNADDDKRFAKPDVPDTLAADESLSSDDQLGNGKEKDANETSIKDSEPEYEDLFRPPSSYKKIEFAKPSQDAFSSTSAFDNDQSLDSSSLLHSSPFQSMFGKTVDQAERDSFGSLFQNLPNVDKDEYTGPRKGSSLQDGGLFSGSLFDERLGQIIQSRPSLDLFGKKRKWPGVSWYY